MELLWHDAFAGTALGAHWVGGHFNDSREARIWLHDGLHIAFEEGADYASAGAVTKKPVAGDFDARVAFQVQAPAQGTTFELAAIVVAPPAHSALDQREATAATRSGVYNVHGVPPYVSSEFDENDGWRIGWNPSLTIPGRAPPTGRTNRYGRDKGPKPAGAVQGWLRLVRSGTAWSSHRLDEATGAWERTGQVLSMDLSGPVHLRLAAKHWVKRRAGLSRAPANAVRFNSFELRAAAH